MNFLDNSYAPPYGRANGVDFLSYFLTIKKANQS
jgi:hypothetical protein